MRSTQRPPRESTRTAGQSRIATRETRARLQHANGEGAMAMVKTLGLTHLALTVSDINRSFQFYHDVFGMLATYREANFIQAQTPGTHDVLVLEEGSGEIGKSGGIKHFGFRLADARDIDKAAAAGGRTRATTNDRPRRGSGGGPGAGSGEIFSGGSRISSSAIQMDTRSRSGT